jgi:iron complex transport system permease protein
VTRAAGGGRERAVLVGAAAALVVAAGVGASVGAAPVPLGASARAVARAAAGGAGRLEGAEYIAWAVRLPRVAMGALVGASLGASGAATQAVFRNPLADPYLLGVASGAAFGATLAMAWGAGGAAGLEASLAPGAGPAVPLAAFAGGLGAVALTAALGRTVARSRDEGLVLAGVVVGSVLTALTTYLMLRDGERLRAVVAWTLGSLALAGWGRVSAVAPYAALGVGALWLLGRPLDALQLGDETAHTLGLRVAWVKWGAIAAASLATGASVAACGVVGFVGLIAPHAMRRLGAPTHRALVASAALAGAALLVLADAGARALARPAELPVGLVLTVVGGPFFLWALRRP